MQTIVMYPVTLADMYSDAIRKQTENASTIELTLEDTMPGKPPKGSVFIASCVVAIVPLSLCYDFVMLFRSDCWGRHRNNCCIGIYYCIMLLLYLNVDLPDLTRSRLNLFL